MNITEIISMGVSCVAGVGGASFIIMEVIKYCSDIIADGLSAKYENKLEKALEKYKTELSKKEYISKAKFDKEFELYQELSEKQITLVYDIGESVLFVRGMYADEPDGAKDFIERFTKNINEAEISLKRYGAFISKEVFEQYRTLDEMGSDVYKLSLYIYEVKYKLKAQVGFSYKGKHFDIDLAEQEIVHLQKSISNLSDQIIDKIREYLSSLDVV